MNANSVLITFLGNIHYDTRTFNLYKTFSEKGFDVDVVSFDWLTERFKAEKGKISVYKLTKKYSSILFYFYFALIISFRILFSKAKFIFAEDVYTLPFCVVFGKMKGARIFYDSREVYGHLAGLGEKKTIQSWLVKIEKTFIQHTTKVFTTGSLDSAHIEKEYNLDETIVIRNLPLYTEIKNPFDFRAHYKLSADTKILLYQGIILHGRGLKIIYDILSELDNCVLVVIGGGEFKDYYQKLSIEKGLSDKVFFFGKLGQNELLNYTAGADIGLSLIENLSLSYYYALPNKMFEYILTGVPVFASNFPQMKDIIDQYNVGSYSDPENREEIISNLQMLIDDNNYRSELKRNCLKASKQLNWEKEIEKLLPYIIIPN
ncbi:MAG: glycosyltransferase [Ignavibacteriaceae bacterium]